MGEKYEPALDGIRGFAVFAVIVCHIVPRPGGALGVDMFFVLSGYLITRILWREFEKNSRLRIGQFLIRRARRLLPALALVLAAYAITAPLFSPTVAAMWREISAAGLYYMNQAIVDGLPIGPLSHTWSLAVEAQFYLVWPFVLLALRPLGPTRAAAVLVAAWAALTIGRIALFYSGETTSAYYSTAFHCTGLLLGAAFALRPVALRWGGVALFLLAALAWYNPANTTFSYSIAATELLTLFVIAAPPRLLTWRPLRLLGVISYGVYLWHVPVWYARGLQSGIDDAIEVIVITVLIASASYLLVERPFLKNRGAGGKISTPEAQAAP